MLGFSKVASFHNETHTFLYKKLGTNFLALTIGILHKALSGTQTAFLY